jgi:hypothetical protein
MAFSLTTIRGMGEKVQTGSHYFTGKDWGTLDEEEMKMEMQLKELLNKARTESSEEIDGGESDKAVTIVDIFTFQGSALEALPGPSGTDHEFGTFNPPPLTPKAIERFNHAKVRQNKEGSGEGSVDSVFEIVEGWLHARSLRTQEATPL